MERSLAVDVAFVGTGTPGDGVAASIYKQYPIINEDSVVFNFTDTTLKAFMAMGIQDPWAILPRAGEPDSVEFAIPSPTEEEQHDFMGGSVDETGWHAPIRIPTIIKSLKIRTLPYEGKYTEYTIVNGLVSARMSQAPGKETSDLMLVKVTKQAVFNAAGVQKSAWGRHVSPIETTAVTAVAISGTAKVGQRLTATVTPDGATGAFVWYKKTGTSAAVAIEGEEFAFYVPKTEDVGSVITVSFVGNDYYSGTVESEATTAVIA